jgi:hypothetical protein
MEQKRDYTGGAREEEKMHQRKARREGKKPVTGENQQGEMRPKTKCSVKR